MNFLILIGLFFYFELHLYYYSIKKNNKRDVLKEKAMFLTMKNKKEWPINRFYIIMHSPQFL